MIIIKNIKMPSSCYDCPFAKNKRTNDYGSFCECGALEDCETINLLEHNKHPNCPLVEQEYVLNKIRAVIEEQEKWLMGAGYNAYNVDIALNAIKLAVAESEK